MTAADLAGLRAGDVITTWHDDGWHGDIVYVRVVRINRATVTVEAENGHQTRVPLARIEGGFERTKPHHWSPWNKAGT